MKARSMFAGSLSVAMVSSALMLAIACPALAELVGWWKLNEAPGSTNVVDSSTPGGVFGGNNGVIAAGALWQTNLAGVSGWTPPYGLTFTGDINPPVDLSAHIADFATLSRGTIALWARLDISASANHIALSMDQYNPPSDRRDIRFGVEKGSIRWYYITNPSNSVQQTIPTLVERFRNDISIPKLEELYQDCTSSERRRALC